MAKWTVNTTAIDNYIKTLEELNSKTDEMLGRAIYPATGMVIEQIKKSINSIPIQNGEGSESNKLTGITSVQRQGLKDGLGIASLQNKDGYVNVKIGFDGYNNTITDKYPKGQPNAMIARSLVAGTSFRVKNNFIQPAVNKIKKKAIEKMDEQVNEEIAKLFAD